MRDSDLEALDFIGRYVRGRDVVVPAYDSAIAGMLDASWDGKEMRLRQLHPQCFGGLQVGGGPDLTLQPVGESCGRWRDSCDGWLGGRSVCGWAHVLSSD